MTLIALVLVVLALAATAAWLYTPDQPRGPLEARYAQPPSTFLDISGLRLHVRDTGPANHHPDAPALILLHGFGASLHTWDAWSAALDSQYRVIRFDLPGFGLTGPDPTGDYTDARTIAVLLALMDRLALPRATLVGNSMGGRIAWLTAALHPSRVEKLVLMSPDGFASAGFKYGKAPKTPLLMRALPYVLPTFMLRATLAPAYANQALVTGPLVANYRDMMLAPGIRQAILDRIPQSILVPPEPLLQQIKAPTLLIWGEQDAMIPHANAADYQHAIPGAQLVSLPGIGHLPQEEAPDHSLAALRTFLEK